MFIPPRWVKVARGLPVSTSQSVTRPAALAPTRVLPSGENMTRSTPALRVRWAYCFLESRGIPELDHPGCGWRSPGACRRG